MYRYHVETSGDFWTVTVEEYVEVHGKAGKWDEVVSATCHTSDQAVEFVDSWRKVVAS